MRSLLFLFLVSTAVPASAGTRAVFDERADRTQIIFEIEEDGDFRAGNERQYRLVIGGETYQVAEADGRVYVARLADLAAAMKETASPLLRAAAKTVTFLGSREQEWVRLGRRNVNGWRGREYRLQDDEGFGTEEDPFEHDDDTSVIVSEDPALQPLGDAMLRYTADELYLKQHLISGLAQEEVLRDMDVLAELGTVIASSEGDIRLAAVGKAEIAPERLALPAEPMKREEIVALIRAKKNPFKPALK